MTKICKPQADKIDFNIFKHKKISYVQLYAAGTERLVGQFESFVKDWLDSSIFLRPMKKVEPRWLHENQKGN